MDCAGSAIFKAAVIETHYVDQLVKAQKESISVLLETIESPGDEGKVYQEKGVFSKDAGGEFIPSQVENETDYDKNDGISRKFMSIETKLAGKNLRRTAIREAGEKTLWQKNMAVLSLPIFTEHSRVRELNDTKGNELAYMAGFDYKSETIDRFVRELKYFQLSHQVLIMTVGFFCTLWKEKSGKDI